jgi:hypothetical protein
MLLPLMAPASAAAGPVERAVQALDKPTMQAAVAEVASKALAAAGHAVAAPSVMQQRARVVPPLGGGSPEEACWGYRGTCAGQIPQTRFTYWGEADADTRLPQGRGCAAYADTRAPAYRGGAEGAASAGPTEAEGQAEQAGLGAAAGGAGGAGDGSMYDGTWCDGRRQGWGMSCKRNGSWYEGWWERDLPHGEGSLFFRSTASAPAAAAAEVAQKNFPRWAERAAADSAGPGSRPPSAATELLRRPADRAAASEAQQPPSEQQKPLALLGSTYCGQFRDGLRHGCGVQYRLAQNTNDARFESDSDDDSDSDCGGGRGQLAAGAGGEADARQLGGGGKPLGSHGGRGAWRYDGQWRNGQRHGQGTMWFSDGSTYTGQWRMDAPGGQGRLLSSSAEGSGSYTGAWAKGAMQGAGVLETSSKKRVHFGGGSEGEFAGDFRAASALQRYEGQFRLNRRHGKGTLHLGNGAR